MCGGTAIASQQFFGSSLSDRFDNAAFEIIVDALFHFSRKVRRRAYQLFSVGSERDFFEQGKRGPSARFSRSERTVVVKADAHCDS